MFYRHNKSGGIYFRFNKFVYNANSNDHNTGEILYFSLQDHKLYRRSIQSFDDIIAIPKDGYTHITDRFSKLSRYEAFKCILKLIFTGGRKWRI